MSLVPEHEHDQDATRAAAQRVLREDTRFAAGRIIAFQYVVMAVILFLLVGFWELQVQRPDYYQEAAERNRIKSQPMPAPRGKILDRDGRVIVDNHASFSLLLSRENLRWEHIRPICEGLNLDYDEVVAKLKRYERTRQKFEAMPLKEDLTPAELAFVEANRDSEWFPELELVQSHRRVYPHDGLAAHVVGYVSEVSDAELDTADFARYKPGDVVGKAGIERQYNDALMGVDGERQVEVDNRGRIVQSFDYKEPTPGKALNLTIDLDLQVVAELALENRRGAVVALDPRNGEVLAMVSRPAYDPAKFAGRISRKDWKEITENPDNPLLNRAIQAQLAPGSTFKPIMALAGLETGVFEQEFQVTCSGGANWFGFYHHCHKKTGHGTIGLRNAIAQSCDVFFYALGNRLGIDAIAKYGEMAGFGRKTGIDLPHEAEGTMPSSRWKMHRFRQKWFAGDTISLAIGQGYLTVTPLQLAVAIGGLSVGGVWHKPHLTRDQVLLANGKAPADMPARKAELNTENVLKVIDGMWTVVNGGGTGYTAHVAGLDICGKTGTAQLASNKFLKGSEAGRSLKDNAWFVGFAPRQSPEIVVVALFESGEHGDRAAPIVRDVIKAYFDKKARTQEPAKSPLVALK